MAEAGMPVSGLTGRGVTVLGVPVGSDEHVVDAVDARVDLEEWLLRVKLLARRRRGATWRLPLKSRVAAMSSRLRFPLFFSGRPSSVAWSTWRQAKERHNG